MLLTITDNDPSKELEYMDLFESYPVDGIILVGTVLSSAHKEKLKKVQSADRSNRTADKRGQLYLP